MDSIAALSGSTAPDPATSTIVPPLSTSPSDPATTLVATTTATPQVATHTDLVMPLTFTDGLPLPRMVVFDLDFTLWPFWVDTHPSPPFKPASGAQAGKVAKDSFGGSYGFYKEVPGILAACRRKNILVGAASRTHTADIARDLLRLLHISESGEAGGGIPARDYFAAMQIYPGNKARHLERLAKQTGVGYGDMVFFDDEHRNSNVESDLGVCFWLVRDGVSREEVDKGIQKWRKQRGGTAGKKKKDKREEL